LTKSTHYWDRVLEVRPDLHLQRLWRAHCNSIHHAIFERWLPRGRVDRLLKTDAFDEALGEGIFPLLSARARWVAVMDLSHRILQTALSRNGSLHAVTADVRHIPYAAGTFDVIVSNSTLDHFDSRRHIISGLSECYRVLHQGGRLLLTLDNLGNPLIRLRHLLPFRLLNHLGIVPYYVGSSYTPHALRRALEEIGFRVSAMTTIMHCPRVFVVPFTQFIQRVAGPQPQKRLLRLLRAFERLSCLPTSYLSGHFVAVLAEKQEETIICRNSPRNSSAPLSTDYQR